MTGTIDVEVLIEQRLQEVEAQLEPFAELEAERERLKRALSALRNEPDAGARQDGRGGNARGARRAPRGSNLKAIISYVTVNPGATSGEIAEATGISRGVVYSAVSRLTNAGKLSRRPKGDGQVAYHAVTAS
jgi:predicted transcriptional regulator